MKFEDFIKNHKVIVGEIDAQKAKALLKMSANNLKAARSVKIDKATASPILSILYEALREIVEAMCLKEGYKVYSHEAFTFYLKALHEEKIAEIF